MSKTRLYTASPSEDYFSYFGPDFTLGDHSGSTVSLMDSHGGMITLVGKGFAFTGDGEVVGGTVRSVIFGDEDGAIFARSTGHNFKFAEVAGQSGSTNMSIGELLAELYRKDDLITGSKDADVLQGFEGDDRILGGAGNDTIYGDMGNDVITGGAGSDVFAVGNWNGKTVITDFDANGGGILQDHLFPYGNDFQEKQKGKDLILIFDEDTRVTLLGVSKNDFDSTDLL